MGKFKDIWNKEYDGENAEKRSFTRYAIFAVAVFIVLVGFLNQNNVVRWVRAGVQIHRQEKQIERYQKEIEEMDEQIRSLNSNKDSLEKFAREQYNFAEKGDDVYKLEDSKK